jgi:hypothetical protein
MRQVYGQNYEAELCAKLCGWFMDRIMKRRDGDTQKESDMDGWEILNSL